MAYNTVVEDNIDILVAGAGLGVAGFSFGTPCEGLIWRVVVELDDNAGHVITAGAVSAGIRR